MLIFCDFCMCYYFVFDDSLIGIILNGKSVEGSNQIKIILVMLLNVVVYVHPTPDSSFISGQQFFHVLTFKRFPLYLYI